MAKNTHYADWYAKLARSDHGDCELPKAAIFDLDGILLDSVDLHALAWQEALLKFGPRHRLFSKARLPGQSNSTRFSLTICAGASPMTRDKVVSAIVAAFGDNLGGKRALGSTWNPIAKDFAAECAQAAREKRGGTKPAPLTPAEKAELREALWPAVSDLGSGPIKVIPSALCL